MGAGRLPNADSGRDCSLNAAGVVAALAAEARALGPSPLRDRGGRRYAMLSDGTLVAVSGIGQAAAAAAPGGSSTPGPGAGELGLAGGLDPTLEAGTVCLPERSHRS